MTRLPLWLRLAPAMMWMALIFYLSHQTGDDLGSVLPFFQAWFPAMQSFDWGHFLAYFILGLTYYWALLPLSLSWRGKLLVVALCVAYGVTDEFHQRFVEGRSPDLLDLRNDAIGAALSMFFVSLPPLDKRFRKQVSSNKY